jgi:hypothetical protein
VFICGFFGKRCAYLSIRVAERPSPMTRLAHIFRLRKVVPASGFVSSLVCSSGNP